MMRYILRFLLYNLLMVGGGQFANAQSNHLYLHTDRDYYLAGDTVWFKGYFLKEGALAKNIHNMYMKLISDEAKEIWRSVALVNNGVTASYFRIPVDYKGKEIFINANTAIDSCVDSKPYLKKLGILQVSTENLPSALEKVREYKLSIQPEGGILLSGLENALLIQALDSRGYPAFVKGKVRDDKGTDVGEFATDSAGLAKLRTSFEADRNYTLQWADPLGIQHQDKIPAAAQGAKVLLIKQDSLLLVQLQGNLPTQTVNVSVSIGKRKLFDQELSLKEGKKINIPLKKSDLEYGILQAVLWNTQHKVISRGSLLVGDDQIQLSPVVTVSSSFQEKSEGRVAVTLPEGEKLAKLSVSVVDVAAGVDSSHSILTDLYLQPLSRQLLNNPQLLWSRATDKNLFIQSQDWDYSYCPTAEAPLPDPLIKIKGQFKLEKGSWSKFYEDYQDEVNKGKKGKLPARGASFGYQDRTAARMKYAELMFDKEGKFEVPDLVVFDSIETKMIQVYRKLKYTPFTVQYKFADPSNYRYPILLPAATVEGAKPLAQPTGLQSDYFSVDARGNRMLRLTEVTRTRRQGEIDRLQRRFRSQEPHTVYQPDTILLPLMDSVVIKTSQSLREYIYRKVPAKSVTVILNGKLMGGTGSTGNVTRNATDPNLMSNIAKVARGSTKADELDRQFKMSFLDADVSSYPYMKFYRSYNSSEYRGDNVLVVFEYSPAEINRDLGSVEYHETIVGYMPLKKYTNKIYSSAAMRLASGPDTRLTLYWDPFFDFNPMEHSKEFVFYNNNRNKGVWVTIQGLTETGKVVNYRRMFKNTEK